VSATPTRSWVLGVAHDGVVSYLPSALYDLIEQSMPIACVDFVSFRVTDGSTQVGLIRRRSPFGVVWCHLGGRVLRGETLKQALQRHAHDTLTVELELGLDPQPAYVYQWFPPALSPTMGAPFGEDPRKHAIGLSYVVEMRGEPAPRNEAIDFAWFAVDDLPADIWPGSQHLVHRLLARYHAT